MTSAAPAHPLSMNAVWRTIRNYVLWSYERGTLHYDIMVTLILIFIFFSPYWINFNDKPKPPQPTPDRCSAPPRCSGTFALSDRSRRNLRGRRLVGAGAIAAHDRADFRPRIDRELRNGCGPRRPRAGL